MDSWDHLRFDLIKEFAYGNGSLDQVQRHHCYNCEECAAVWRAYKREAKVIERAKALRAKAEGEIARLLKEYPTKSDEKSA